VTVTSSLLLYHNISRGNTTHFIFLDLYTRTFYTHFVLWVAVVTSADKRTSAQSLHSLLCLTNSMSSEFHVMFFCCCSYTTCELHWVCGRTSVFVKVEGTEPRENVSVEDDHIVWTERPYDWRGKTEKYAGAVKHLPPPQFILTNISLSPPPPISLPHKIYI